MPGEENTAKTFFESFGEPISVYTDAQAVEDGVLVALNFKNRVTRALFEWLAETTPTTAQPPSNWPVDMQGWFTAWRIVNKVNPTEEDQKQFRMKKAAALADGLVSQYESRARRVYEENTGGGILQLWACCSRAGDRLYALVEKDPGESYYNRKLWLIPNEMGGMTLMFPEDY